MLDIRELFDENERPLERFPADGGFAGVFRTVGCIGDSLSSGEFQGTDAEGKSTYHDMFDFSWGQYLARNAGLKVHNFSRGGMTAKWYMTTFADENGFWDAGMDCQAYIIAMGCNDVTKVLNGELPMGSLDDICDADYTRNADTAIGWYAAMMQKLFARQPHVHLFLMTMPKGTQALNPGGRAEKVAEYNENIRKLAERFPRTWLIDLEKYAPVYDEYFLSKFFMDGHMNPAGYLLTARMVASYMDYIVRHNIEHFEQIGFYGTDLLNSHYIK